MKFLLHAAVAAIALSFSLTAIAADKKDEKKDDKSAPETATAHTLADFKIGDLITGPEVKLDEIKGKAVVIENWGVNCGPCIASLPEMERMAKRNKEKLVVIGAHCQEATDEKVKEVVKKYKLSYTIVKGNNAPSAVSSGTIPHAYVFDAEGKLVFHGRPSDREFEKAVRKAMPKKA